MTSRRLTNKIREEILTDVMRDLFKDRVTEVVKRGEELAEECFNYTFRADEQRLVGLELKHSWLTNRTDKVMLTVAGDVLNLTSRKTGRFNALEFTGPHYVLHPLNTNIVHGFQLPRTVALPPHAGRGVPVEAEAHRERFDRLRDDALALVTEERNLYGELYQFLHACKNAKEVLANWPEGEKYLPKDENPKKLPIPLIDNIRDAMK